MHPLDLPNDVGVLIWDVLGRGEWKVVLSVSDVVDRDIAVRVADSDEMGLLLGELAACDTVVSPDDSLGELRVLERPEAEKTGLEQPVIGAVDVVLTITDSNQIRVLHIDVDR